MTQLLKTEFEGRVGSTLRLSLWTAMLSVVTLGFYRFWMKTRLRRHFWSAVRPDGTPLEYVGKGIEKFTGFLIALVVLAFLIGVLALVLVYASYAVFQGELEAYLVAALIAVPLIYFASYRAKRYVYARTRWRGIRFALEPAAGKYTLHAMGHLLLTVLTLGFLWPRMTFKLEKFRTDRTFFSGINGCIRADDGGGLAKSFLPTLVCIWLGLGLIGRVAFLEASPQATDSDFFSPSEQLRSLAIVPVLLLLGVFLYLRYRVVALRYLANHKTAGGVGLISRLSFPRVLWINIAGYTLTNICTAIATFVVGAAASAVLVAVYPGLADFGVFASGAVTEGAGISEDGMPSAGVSLAFALFLYMTTLLFFAVFRQTFVLFPTWRHYAQTLSLTGGEHLADIRQRDRDHAGQAEGMAEAFDLGAAI